MLNFGQGKTCDECGKPIEMFEPFYCRTTDGAKASYYHSKCGDPLGIKAAVLAERTRCENIALAIDSGRGNEKLIARAIRDGGDRVILSQHEFIDATGGPDTEPG